MNNHEFIDYYTIESLIALLDIPKKEYTGDNQPEKTLSTGSLSSTTAQHKPAVQYLKQFTDGMPGGFFIYHADGKQDILYANEAMFHIFGCSNMEEFRSLTGNSFHGIVHPDDLADVERSIAEQIAASQNNCDYVEYRIIRKDGEVRWLRDYGRFIHSELAGDIFYVFVSDATEEKRRQFEEHNKELTTIRQEQLRCLEMIEGLSIDYESIFHADLDHDRIKAYRVSQRFAKQFPEEHNERRFTGFDTEYIKNWVYPEDRDLVCGISTPEYIRSKLSGHKTFHVNYRIFRDGQTAYIQLRIVRIDSGSHISQIVLGYRNIDEEIIQEMEQKQILTEALNKANMANSAKNLFLSNMSHDIRTPMNAIIGFASLAKKHLHDRDKLTDYLNMISTSSDQLLQLLNGALEISRIQSGKIDTDEKECNITDILNQIQDSLLPQAARKNISLTVDISSLSHDAVFADQQKISTILSYIVDNAIKYTNPDGNVSITIIEQKELADAHAIYQFVVEDNGIGISRDFQKYLFKPFERENNTTMSGIHGTGLSLSIAKELAEIIGGTITVSSVPGQGSTFTLTVSLLRQNFTAEEHPYTASLPIPDSGAKRILIVDDNEINLEIENEVLKDAGYIVDNASDGSIAVEKVKKSPPGYYDLILMDIQMPIMDGYHATRAIRKIDNPTIAGIPIIAVSANTFEEDKQAAIECGMNAHIAKPVDTPLLYNVIRRFLKDQQDM